MGRDLSEWIAHPAGEQPEVEEWSAVAETFAGRVHIEWDTTAAVTPLGQLPFFVEYLKQGGLFDGWVADCPLSFTSPNAPRKRDVLGTLLLSVLAGHRRYAPPRRTSLFRRLSAKRSAAAGDQSPWKSPVDRWPTPSSAGPC